MRKQFKTYFIPILVVFVLILPGNNIIPESTFQKLITNLNDDYSVRKPFLKHQQTINPNKTFLPNTNLTISSYLDTTFENTFNATVLSLNKTHWFIHCDYSIPTLDEPSFDSVVNRTSINHGYEASNYWEWHGDPSPTFDFWIDTTGFYDKYQLAMGPYTATVSADTIYMTRIDQEFNAWKITIDVGIIITIWYADDSGLFLCMKEDWTASLIWFNLTRAEIALPPEDYSGPNLKQVSHNNNSKLASSTLISFEFASPYGIDIIYYHWDHDDNSTTFSSFFNVNLPEENTSHDILIIAFDNAGYYNSYSLVFITDDTSPGISLLNYQNNSKIHGSSKIRISVSSGNGNITYYWDSTSNTTVSEGTPIDVANSTLEMVKVLNVFVESPAGIWSYNRFVFTIDNTPPNMIIENPINNSIIKGTVNLRISVSERSNLTYSIEPIIKNGSIFVETGMNHTISFSDLENGSYRLVISATDEANNINETTLFFSIHTSAFDWTWDLNAESPNTLNLVDATGKLLFQLTLVSKTNQTFNLTVLPETTPPTRINTMLYGIKFTCDAPKDILFMTFTFLLNGSSSAIDSTIEVYKWAYWDNQEEKWLILETSYNSVTHSWQATHEGNITLFALIKTDETTSLTSVIPGGGQIPSFEYSVILLGLFFIRYLLLMRKKSVKKTLNRVQGEQ